MPNFFINVKEKGAKKAAGSIGALTKRLALMAVAAVGVSKAVDGLRKSITISAEMEGVKRGFDNLAKSAGFSTQAFSKFRTATDGTIDSLTLMKQANNAMLLGITDSEDQMAQMFDVAQRLGQSLGIDTVQSIESLVTGLGRQSKLMLDNLGIMVDTNRAYEDHAEAIGKSTSELTDQERKTAFVNAAMKEANSLVAQLGDEQLTTKDSMAQVVTVAGDLAVVIGDKLSPAIRFASEHLVSIMESVEGFIDWADGMNTVSEAQDKMTKGAELVDDITEKYNLFGESNESLALNMSRVIAVLEPQLEGLAHYDKLAVNLRGDIKKLRREIELVVQAEAIQLEGLEAATPRYESTTESIAGYLDVIEKIPVINADIETSMGGPIKNQMKLNDLFDVHAKKNKIWSQAISGAASINQGASKQNALIAKRAAQLEAFVNTASAVTEVLPNIPLAIAMGALGAVQIAKIEASKFATGADFVTSGPQMMMVGDNPSGMERVQVTPLGGDPNIDGPQGGGSLTVNISGNLMSSEYVEGELADQIKNAIRRGTDFGQS